MDRRERYDPEDIEILMQERSFDELLEEERAYVLRHVSDRAEYESMRGLLMHMRDVPDDHGPIEADPAIRGRVMQAFRDQQQPQWRIWLNSVAAWLVPGNAFAIWRPALALAGLALVIGFAVLLVDQSTVPPAELAELQPIKTKDQSSVAEPKEDRSRARAETQSQDTRQAEVAKDIPPAPKTSSITDEILSEQDDAVFDSEMPFSFSEEMAEIKLESTISEDAVQVMDSEIARSSHMVTAEELSRNMSIANMTGRVHAKEARSDELVQATGAQPKGSMAQHAQLFELLATGW